MLFDIKDLDKKRRAEEGDQEVLFELAELYIKLDDFQAFETAFKYYKKVVKIACNCNPLHYFESLKMCAASAMELDNKEEALVYAERAKAFMEEHLSVENWDSYIYSCIKEVKTIQPYEHKLKAAKGVGEQQALLAIARLYRDGNLAVESHAIYNRKAAFYYGEIIKQGCEIDKGDYLEAFVWLGNHHYSEGDNKAALDILFQGKKFMEQEIEPEQWDIELYDLIISSKYYMINPEEAAKEDFELD